MLRMLIILAFLAASGLTPSSLNAADNPTTPTPTVLPGVNIPGNDDADQPEPGPHVLFLCFEILGMRNSAVQPYILQSRSSVHGVSPKSSKPTSPPCTTVDEKHPLKRGDKLVVVIQGGQNVFDNYVELLNLNITATAATFINVAPTRPSIAQPNGNPSFKTPNPAATQQLKYLVWPIPLQGDTIPEIAIHMIYSPTKIPPASDTVPPPAAGEYPITLLDLTYPQVHQLSHFNIATGVVGSSLHNSNFLRLQTTGATGTSGQPGYVPADYVTTKISGSPQVFPLLMFSAYFTPFDAERKWHRSDLIPEPGVGFSLSSPSTDFFLGGSSEIRRNVQIVGGLHIGKTTSLVKPPFDDPTSSTAPTTTQDFNLGAFAGLTFNIDFIKSLFSAK
ncbi:MAG: hypothetical protein ACR2JE_08495 [Acidobacteriaceae bacterium]